MNSKGSTVEDRVTPVTMTAISGSETLVYRFLTAVTAIETPAKKAASSRRRLLYLFLQYIEKRWVVLLIDMVHIPQPRLTDFRATAVLP